MPLFNPAISRAQAILENPVFTGFGGKGDGSTSNAQVFVRAREFMLNEKRPVVIPGGKFLIETRFDIPDGGGFTSDGGGTLFAPNSAFNNQDQSLSGRYGTNAVVLNASGELSGAYVKRKNVVVRGIKIEYQTTSAKRLITGVLSLNSQDINIDNVEVSGIPLGYGVRLASVSGVARVSNCYIHDFYDNNTWSDLPQSTGIEVDNDIINGQISDPVLIIGNRIANIVVGPAFVAAYGDQTDGVGLVRGKGHRVLGNVIVNVAEGVDAFAKHCVIDGNYIEGARYFGVKLIHGASYNVVSRNQILGAGLYGVLLSGSSDPAVTDCACNIVKDNEIINIDPNNINPGADSRACLATTDNGPSSNPSKVRNAVFSGNICDPGTNGRYVIFRGGTGQADYRDNVPVKSGISGYVAGIDEKGVLMWARSTNFACYPSAPVALTATLALVKFDTIVVDSGDEYSASTGLLTVKRPGRYRVEAQFRIDYALDGSKEINGAIYVNGAPKAQSPRQFNSTITVGAMQLSKELTLNAGDTIGLWAKSDDLRPITAGDVYSWWSVKPV